MWTKPIIVLALLSGLCFAATVALALSPLWNNAAKCSEVLEDLQKEQSLVELSHAPS